MPPAKPRDEPPEQGRTDVDDIDADEWWIRFGVATNAGLNDHDAGQFASGDTTILLLLRLVAQKCPPDLLSRIVT